MLCRTVREDEHGLLCIEGILDGFIVPEVPILGKGALVIRLRGKPNQEVTLKIDLRRPTGESLSRAIPSATMTIETSGRLDQSVELQLPFPQTGRYELHVSANGQTRVVPFTVELSSPAVVH